MKKEEIFRTTTVSFQTDVPENENSDAIFGELASLLDPGEKMTVSYSHGRYIVTFDHEQVFCEDVFPPHLWKKMKFE